MKKKRLTLIHTSPVMIPVFSELCRELLAGIEAVHMVDESLLKDILKNGCLTKPTARRVIQHILSADQAGADAILVTCSSIGKAAEIEMTGRLDRGQKSMSRARPSLMLAVNG